MISTVDWNEPRTHEDLWLTVQACMAQWLSALHTDVRGDIEVLGEEEMCRFDLSFQRNRVPYKGILMHVEVSIVIRMRNNSTPPPRKMTKQEWDEREREREAGLLVEYCDDVIMWYHIEVEAGRVMFPMIAGTDDWDTSVSPKVTTVVATPGAACAEPVIEVFAVMGLL